MSHWTLSLKTIFLLVLEVVKIAMELELDILSLPSHTNHILQPLDVACFKAFENVFKR